MNISRLAELALNPAGFDTTKAAVSDQRRRLDQRRDSIDDAQHAADT
jgi:hypothetical protein